MPVFDFVGLKQSKSNLACLAQSVEHAAVNRSVGGPSPSTGAKTNHSTEWFFCYHYVIGPLWPCHYALHTTLLLAVDAHKFANTRWPSAQQAPKQTTQTSGFFVVFVGTGHPHLWCMALPQTLLFAVVAPFICACTHIVYH